MGEYEHRISPAKKPSLNKPSLALVPIEEDVGRRYKSLITELRALFVLLGEDPSASFVHYIGTQSYTKLLGQVAPEVGVG